MDTTVKLDLMEYGTRYDHYQELKEAFDVGIEMLTNALKLEDNLTSRENLKRLQNASASIEARINYLADWAKLTTLYSNFGRTLDSIAPHRTLQLTEGSNAKDGSQTGNQTGQGTSPQNPE
jgi:hypothetical protein